MQLDWVVLVIFCLAYLFIIISKHHRAKALWIGVGLMMLAGLILRGQDAKGYLAPLNVFFNPRAINWNVMGILAGAMLIADFFIESRVPVLLADLLAERCKSAHMALLGVCMLSGFISIFVDNVTTVLIVAPVALVIAKRTGMSPVPFLIGMAVSSNLQGAGTLIGDPPSMLLASHITNYHEPFTFNDFFFHQGKPSMFFVMQAGAIASFIVLYVIFRGHKHAMPKVEEEKPNTWVPTVFIAAMVAHLALASVFDPGFVWLAGAGNAALALILLVWTVRRDRALVKKIIKRYDLPTLTFLAGIFVMAYVMNSFGWVAAIARGIEAVVGDSPFMAFTVIVWFSVLVSAFIDNIAYVALMLPVTSALAESIGGPPFLYAAGLLVGACLGGNITPVGAACNVVACGILRREGHAVSFWEFVKIGLPFTLAATGAGYAFVWLVWGV